MAKGTVNKVIIVGRLGSDPEVRYTPSGAAVANFSLATNRSYKDKDGNWQEETDWHKVVFWKRQAEVLKEYCRKGSRIYVEGRLQTRSWEDQNGQKRYTTEIIGYDLQLLDSSGSTGAGSGHSSPPPPGSGMKPPPETNLPEPPAEDFYPPDDVPF